MCKTIYLLNLSNLLIGMDSQHMFDLLYESLVIPSGQFLFKTLPVEKLIHKVEDERLKVNLDGFELENPVILASHYSDLRILEKARKLGFGTVTSKTIKINEEKGNPRVTVVRRYDGLANCERLRGPGMEYFKAMLDSRERIKGLIISVTGETGKDYGLLVKTLSPYADIIEINISCTNEKSIYELSENPEKLKDLFYYARNSTDGPIDVKLSPDFEDNNYSFVIPLAIKNGIKIINFGNTIRVEEPRLSQGFGGYSGPGLFDNVVRNVHMIRKEFGNDVYIIATGGIDSPEKTNLLLRYAGADAVSFLTAFFKPNLSGLFLPSRINDYLIRNSPKG